MSLSEQQPCQGSQVVDMPAHAPVLRTCCWVQDDPMVVMRRIVNENWAIKYPPYLSASAKVRHLPQPAFALSRVPGLLYTPCTLTSIPPMSLPRGPHALGVREATCSWLCPGSCTQPLLRGCSARQATPSPPLLAVLSATRACPCDHPTRRPGLCTQLLSVGGHKAVP